LMRWLISSGKSWTHFVFATNLALLLFASAASARRRMPT